MRLVTFFLIMASSQAFAAKEPSREVPEAFTGLNYQKASYSKKAMVTAANPHAVNAGVKMLEMGGNAIDAAISIQLVLTLVEPQSSGIGGGAFLMWHDAVSQSLTTYDGRETAPASATPELFLGKDGKPVRWIKAVIGGRSVGVPSVLRMMADVHQEKGKLPWKTLFQPAIKLANEGFTVSPRLAKLVAMRFNPGIEKLSPAKEYFFPNGVPLQEGQLLKNKEYAEVLTTIANQGVDAFYQGAIAKDIAKAVQTADIAPGLLSAEDIGQYKSVERPAFCTPYLADTGEEYKICSMGPPSSGGLTVLQILKLLEPYKLTKHSADSLQTVHLYSQAAKLAFADRNTYLADSDFVFVPTEQYLDKQYLDQRRANINLTKDMGKAHAGKLTENTLAHNISVSQPNTSHLSIIDNYGNALSMTSSIEMGFGSTVMVHGFLLNNQLTDFSLRPKVGGKWVANRVQGNKRPRSSMTPVIVYKNDEVYAVLGSPGGSRIINYVGYALIGLLDFGLDMEAVVKMPRISNRNGYTALEKNTSITVLQSQLEQMGHKVRLVDMTSGIHGILKTDKGWQGVADPRREGTAIGL